MKKSRYTEEQVAYALRLAESGTPVADVCRQTGIAEATFYLWKKKYGSLGVPEVRELRQMREENARLKRLVADFTLDKQILQEVIRKKSETSAQTGAGSVDARPLPGELSARLQAGAQSVRIPGITRRRRATCPLRLRVREIAQALPRFGYVRIWVMLRREGWAGQQEARPSPIPPRGFHA